MILLWSHDGGRLVIGLTGKNIDRLLMLEPASTDTPRPLRVEKILIMYGRDKVHLLEQLEAANVEVPEHLKREAADDPS